jgi:hypothetical protein
LSARRVLAIGLDPAAIDPAALAGFAPDLVRAYIDAEISRLGDLGFQVESCLIDPGETAEAAVETALRSGDFDCIIIGAGLREPPERLLLFERVLNLVHRLAPASRIAFNTSPGDTAEAALRWIGNG